jgi:hypothetical protein
VRAVADSSVLISAFRSGPPREVFFAARQQRFILCLSLFLLEEIRRGLLRERNRARYRYAAAQVDPFVAALVSGAVVVRRVPAIDPVCRGSGCRSHSGCRARSTSRSDLMPTALPDSGRWT